MIDAKYQVFDALISAIDDAYEAIRAQCAETDEMKEPSVQPLALAIENVMEYKRALARVREIEQTALFAASKKSASSGAGDEAKGISGLN